MYKAVIQHAYFAYALLPKHCKALQDAGFKYSSKTQGLYLFSIELMIEKTRDESILDVLIQPSSLMVDIASEEVYSKIPSLSLLKLKTYDDSFKASLAASFALIADTDSEKTRLSDAFGHLLQMIQTAKSPIKERMVQNLGHILMLSQVFNLSIDTIINAQPLFKALLEYQDPDIKENLRFIKSTSRG